MAYSLTADRPLLHVSQVPHVDENWQYMQGARVTIFSDLTRPGAAFTVERDTSYRSSVRDQHSLLHVAIPHVAYAGATFPFERRVCALASTEPTCAAPTAPAAPGPADAAGPTGFAEEDEGEPDFVSPSALTLWHDSAEAERVGLGIRALHRTLTPQLTESPLYLHCTRTDRDGLHQCLDQSADVGLDMVILSFGTNQDHESEDERYVAAMRRVIEEVVPELFADPEPAPQGRPSSASPALSLSCSDYDGR